MSTDSDRLLVQQIRAGDPAAWQQLIDRYEGRLLAFAQRRLGDPAASEDVVQEAFLGFLNSLPNYDDRRGLQTYLFTITAHKITDQLRRQGRRPWVTGSDGEEVLAREIDPNAPAASSLARSRERIELEQEVLARGLGQMLAAWMNKGDYLRVRVLELLFVKGWANCAVAAALQLTEQQVANFRFAAMRKLGELVRSAGLPADVFPELNDAGPE